MPWISKRDWRRLNERVIELRDAAERAHAESVERRERLMARLDERTAELAESRRRFDAIADRLDGRKGN